MAVAGQLAADSPDAPTTPEQPAPENPVEEWIAETDRLVERAARTHLWLLATVSDSLVVTAHDEATARAVQDRAQTLLPDETTQAPTIEQREQFATQLIEERINPGMTADLLAAGLFVALERDGVAL
jgi:triphosphoribosyl-dephospho-CoA synthase